MKSLEKSSNKNCNNTQNYANNTTKNIKIKN